MDDALRAAIRTTPFFRFDMNRVRERAYFLGLSGGDPLASWLRAEAEETLAQAIEQLFLTEEAAAFLGDYRLVGSFQYETNAPSRPYFYRKTPVRRCSICGLDERATSFRKDAHLLPASLGNRAARAHEECDACNLRFGAEHDRHIADMLAPYRALGRVRTRDKPSATLRPAAGNGRFGGQGYGAPLQIQVERGVAELAVEQVDDRTMSLSGAFPVYRPISALKSLARTAWYVAPPATRARCPEVLGWLRGAGEAPPLEYLRAFLPGPGLPDTTFAVWEHRGGGTRSPLAWMLALGNVVIMCAPALRPEQADAISPRPIPPLPLLSDGPPVLTLVSVASDDPVRMGFKFEISHEARYVVASASPLRTELLLMAPVGTFRLLCNLDVLSAPADEELVYRLHGDDVPGELLLRGAPGSKLPSGAARFSMEAWLESPPAPGTPLEGFLTALSTGGVLRIRTPEGGIIISDLEVPAQAALPAEEDAGGGGRVV